MSEEQTQIEYLLTVNTQEAETSILKLESAVIRASNQIARLTGNQDIQSLVTMSNRAIYAARSIQQAIQATSIALAGAGPIGWLVMGTSILSAGFSTVDFMTQSQM